MTVRGERSVVYEVQDGGSSKEATVAPEVFSLRPRYITGVVEEEDGELVVYIDQDGYEENVLVHIPSSVDVKDLSPNDIVVFRDGTVGDEDEWVVHKVCGQLGDSKAEVEALMYRSGTSPEFTPETLEQVEGLQSRYETEGDSAFMEREATTFVDNQGKEKRGSLVLEKEQYRHGETRLDLRNREDIDIFTIDPESAKDFDDAISFRKITKPDGTTTYEVGIHIADVAHFAKLGSALEKDARFRQFTRYLKLITATMLPEFLSNTLCSLEEGKDRLTYSTIFTFNEDGSFAEEPWFGRALIRSKGRLTYAGADEVLIDLNDPRHEAMRTVHRFTGVLRKGREDRGAIAFEQQPEADITYDPETGKAISIAPKNRTETSLLIEDLMLAANEAQGAYLVDAEGGEMPILLRAHSMPPIGKILDVAERVIGWDPDNEDNVELLEALRQFEEVEAIADPEERAAALQVLQDSDVPARILNNLQKRSQGEGNSQIQETIRGSLRRLFGRAFYTTDKEEHFSLAVEPYLHATSPIRRYPDMITQYLMDEKQRRREGVSGSNDMSLQFLKEVAVRANVARAQAREAELDAVNIAYLDLVEKMGIGTSFSGRNAVVVNAGRKGVRVALTLKGGYKHFVLIPWDQFPNVETDEKGRQVYLHKKRDGTVKKQNAFRRFGPPFPNKDGSSAGVRTLSLRVVAIDRKNRQVVFSVAGTKVLGSS